MGKQTIKAEDLFYPEAINWMWNYCIWLGKFTDSTGRNYDLGIHINKGEYNGKPYKEISGAIVSGNRPGDYYSGDVNANRKNERVHDEMYVETYKRAKEKNLI